MALTGPPLVTECRGIYHLGMSRGPNPEKFSIESVELDLSEADRGWTLVDRETAVPTWFKATIQLERPLFLVTINISMELGRPVVRKLEVTPGRRNSEGTFSAPRGEGITTTNLRQLLIDRLVRAAVEKAKRPATSAHREVSSALRGSGVPAAAADELARAAFNVGGDDLTTTVARIALTPLAGRGRETPKDRIVKAATIYRNAVAAGSKSPVKDVGIALNYSTSQASRYLAAARADGLLDGVDDGQADDDAE